MEWSLGVEPLSGVLEWILEWNEVKFGVIVALLGQELYFIPFDSFAMCRSLASLFHKQKTIIGIFRCPPVLFSLRP